MAFNIDDWVARTQGHYWDVDGYAGAQCWDLWAKYCMDAFSLPMGAEDLERDGLDSSVVDNISLWLLNEGSPTCYGRDERWASHLYPVYLTETLIKASFESDLVFISNFKRKFQ